MLIRVAAFSIRVIWAAPVFVSALAAQNTPDQRTKADCEPTASRLTGLLNVIPKDAATQHRPKACAALRDEAANQIRLSIAVEHAACEAPNAQGLSAAQKAQIERRTAASNRLLDLMRDCEEAMKIADATATQPADRRKAAEPKKAPEITSCAIYKQASDERRIEKRFAAIRRADPEGAKCKLELPTAYAKHCGAAGSAKAEWPKDEFNRDLADLIKLAIDMSRCEASLQIKK